MDSTAQIRSLCYGSVCSGIECASVAWQHLGWRPMWFAETDANCAAFLARKYSDVPNLGNMEAIESGKAEAIDLLIGGTPCQSFSINGRREGLASANGNLAVSFMEIIDRFSPRWIVWENSPNVLRTNGGEDFASLLWQLGDRGYWWAYRVLDAQFFGLPHRRKRIFVVANARNSAAAFAALFDRPPAFSTCGTLEKARQADVAGIGKAADGWVGDETPKRGIGVMPTLRAQQGGEGAGVAAGNRLRKLSITEWERLQGLPDNYTSCMASDAIRRKAIGNGFPVNVIRWIGERIHFLENLQ
jgi:DNA (cytosine-5)-methyltransferase 1